MKLKLLKPLLLIFFLLSLASHAYALPDCTDERETLDDCTGAYIWANGMRYDGEFKNGLPHGKGATTHPNGDRYVGEFKSGDKHGNGTFAYSNGSSYVGEFKDGKRHGKGTFTWASGSFAGDKYVGEYKDNKRTGKGTYTRANGTVKSGIWADGKYLYKSVESTRSDCAKEAGKAGTEYAAKQIEKTCLAEKQLEPEPEPESKGWFDW